MKQSFFTIEENVHLTDNVLRMRLRGDTSDVKGPGQFVNILIDGCYLRRPISVCDVQGDILTIVYKVVGKGTEALSNMTSGQLDVLSGLGNGYDLEKAGENPLLIGGGVGVPPLYWLARELKERGKQVSVILGFNTASEAILEEEFRKLGCEVTVTTVDGSAGIKGFVTAAMEDIRPSFFYTCGPEPMLKAVYRGTECAGQFSFEERMGCGFGACMGCSCRTLTGYKRICKDGPVLDKEEILWQI